MLTQEQSESFEEYTWAYAESLNRLLKSADGNTSPSHEDEIVYAVSFEGSDFAATFYVPRVENAVDEPPRRGKWKPSPDKKLTTILQEKSYNLLKTFEFELELDFDLEIELETELTSKVEYFLLFFEKLDFFSFDLLLFFCKFLFFSLNILSFLIFNLFLFLVLFFFFNFLIFTGDLIFLIL